VQPDRAERFASRVGDSSGELVVLGSYPVSISSWRRQT